MLSERFYDACLRTCILVMSHHVTDHQVKTGGRFHITKLTYQNHNFTCPPLRLGRGLFRWRDTRGTCGWAHLVGEAPPQLQGEPLLHVCGPLCVVLLLVLSSLGVRLGWRVSRAPAGRETVVVAAAAAPGQPRPHLTGAPARPGRALRPARRTHVLLSAASWRTFPAVRWSKYNTVTLKISWLS